MQIINLKQYYPFCKEDTFVEVSEEVVETFLLFKRAEAARERKMYRYKAYYSLNYGNGTEKDAIGWAQPSPEDFLIEQEEEADHEQLIRNLYDSLSILTPLQSKRIYARYIQGLKVKEIAAIEGVDPSNISGSIRSGLKRLREHFARRKWTRNGL